MKLKIVAVGKLKEKYFTDMQAEYVKRLSRFATAEICELADAPCPDRPTPAQTEVVLSREGAGIARAAEGYRNVVALTPEGRRVSSEAFAELIEGYMRSGEPDVCFIIGGSLGIDAEIKKKSLCLSMSDMTFPHRLARVMLLEQLYRAFKIINHEVYHK